MWVYVLPAIALEAVFVVALSESRGFRSLWPSLITLVAGMGSLFCLSKATDHVPISIAYPVWVGGGVLAAAIVDAFRRGVTPTLQQSAFLLLLLIAIVGIDATKPS